MAKNRAKLLLEDGTEYSGESVGVDGIAVGEVVFNTSLTGYQEISTDPSYHSQIITFTNPHIGNTGVNDEDLESSKVHASGIIFRDSELEVSNWRHKSTFREFLHVNKIIAISGIDTRALTRKIRNQGALNGCIVSDESDLSKAQKKLSVFRGLLDKDLAIEVTTNKVYQWEEKLINILGETHKDTKDNYNVVVYDYGVKQNILRILKTGGCKLTVVPADYSVEKVFKLNPDGVFLSNGPGDPKACEYAIKNITKIISKRIPIFGICLGFQLLALSLGAKTKKMKFGHHGANHPVLDLSENKVLITSQNHGFEVDVDSLPSDISLTHKSLFDHSLQGFYSEEKNLYGFQGHPEASPGPHDIHSVFERFYHLMDKKHAS